MRPPTPTFTPTSKQGAEALATAEAAGVALEAAGRRVRFVGGALIGAVGGFIAIADNWASDPAQQTALERSGALGFWALIVFIALLSGAATARWGWGIWAGRRRGGGVIWRTRRF